VQPGQVLSAFWKEPFAGARSSRNKACDQRLSFGWSISGFAVGRVAAASAR